MPNEFKNDPQPLYANMSAALNATGRPIAFSMCEWGVANPWTWGDAIAQSWREAGDHTGVWSSTKSVIQSSAAIPAEFSGRPYGWNDMVRFQRQSHPANQRAKFPSTLTPTKIGHARDGLLRAVRARQRAPAQPHRYRV